MDKNYDIITFILRRLRVANFADIEMATKKEMEVIHYRFLVKKMLMPSEFKGCAM